MLGSLFFSHRFKHVVKIKKRTMYLTELVDMFLKGNLPFIILEGESRQSPVNDDSFVENTLVGRHYTLVVNVLPILI